MMIAAPAPVISVVLLVYNHEKYVRQALDSIASQKTTFDVELIISEDKSTDRSRNIIEEFLKGYKGSVSLLYSEQNLHIGEVATRAFRAAKGKYIAYLDGDDYWCSDVKLQRQFEFMEANPGCAVSHHDVARVDSDGTVIRVMPGLQRQATVDDIIRGNFIQSCSAMVRRGAVLPIPSWIDQLPLADWPIYVLAAQHGYIGWTEGVLGHYRVHEGAVWSTLSETRQWVGAIAMLQVLEEHFGEQRREVFAETRGNIIKLLETALASEQGRKLDEIVLRERELAANQRADDAIAAARAAASLAEQRAALSFSREASAFALLVQREGQFGQERAAAHGSLDRMTQAFTDISYQLRRVRKTTRRIATLGVGVVVLMAVTIAWLVWKGQF